MTGRSHGSGLSILQGHPGQVAPIVTVIGAIQAACLVVERLCLPYLTYDQDSMYSAAQVIMLELCSFTASWQKPLPSST